MTDTNGKPRKIVPISFIGEQTHIVSETQKMVDTFLLWLDELGRYAKKPPICIICEMENIYDTPFNADGVCAGCIGDAMLDEWG